MTFAQMVIEAELLYESINSSDAPGFLNTEWASFLTIAQRRIVLRILKEGINKNAFNQLAIEKLVKRDSYSVFTTDNHFKNTDGSTSLCLLITAPPVGKPFDVDYFWVLDEYVSTSTITNIPVKRITYDFYRLNLKNPFRVPDVNEGYWVLQYDNTPVFITDGTTITGYYVIGVEHPDNYPIGSVAPASDCILNESIHSMIVEEAVGLARMSVVDTPGYQLATNEFSKS